jgi:hypothetical protein
MKTLSQSLAQIFDQIVRVFQSNRDAYRAWLDACAAQLFPTHAVVRAVNRQQYQRLHAAKARRQQE